MFPLYQKKKFDIKFQCPPCPPFSQKYCVVFCAHATNKGMYLQKGKKKNEALPLGKEVRAEIV